MKRRISDRRRQYESDAAVNPMDGVGNMADAMLVLAVGIMLALIINWNVDLGIVTASTQVEAQDSVEFTQQDMEKVDDEEKTPDGGDLTRLGSIYYDEESDTYYIIQTESLEE